MTLPPPGQVSGAKVAELGLKPLARIISWGEAAQEPERFTTSPSLAIPKALSRANLSVDKARSARGHSESATRWPCPAKWTRVTGPHERILQVDFFEINEAFAVVSVANNKLLKLDPKKVNVFGVRRARRYARARLAPPDSEGDRAPGKRWVALDTTQPSAINKIVCTGSRGAWAPDRLQRGTHRRDAVECAAAEGRANRLRSDLQRCGARRDDGTCTRSFSSSVRT